MAKSERLYLRLEPEEREAFQQAADLTGLPLSTWVRLRLRLAATNELEAAGERVPFIAPIPLGGLDE